MFVEREFFQVLIVSVHVVLRVLLVLWVLRVLLVLWALLRVLVLNLGMLVMLVHLDQDPQRVLETLADRFGISGHAEKASRG